MKLTFLPACCLLSLLFITGLHCIKRQVECTGNCTPVQVSGIAINKLTGEGVAGVPFQLSWSDSHITLNDLMGLYIFNGSSGSNGLISFITSVDSTRFAAENLSVRMVTNDKFVMDNDNPESLFLDRYSLGGLRNIVLGVYPQAKLVLHIQAPAQNTIYKSFLVKYQYDNKRIFTACAITLGQFTTHE